MDRRAQLLSMFDASGFGLEIGPSYNPFLAKADGFNVETLDHADQATLRAHYANDGTVDTDRIEPVDYVSDGRSMVDVIGATGRYDFIMASHMIEHTPDLVGFLRDCEALLKPDGVLVLAVPDNRYCFDKLRPLSSIGQIVEAAHEKRTRHTMASLFDHVAYYCELDGRGSWLRSEDGTLRILFPLKHAEERRALYYRPEYTDNHAWQFTPSSFRLIIEDLHTLGLSSLREAGFAETDFCEFQAVLSRNGTGPGASRDELASRSLDEIAEAAPGRMKAAALEAGTSASAVSNSELERAHTDLATAKGETAALRDALGAELEQAHRALATARAETVALREAFGLDLERTNSELATARAEASALRDALEQTRRARSWRLTAPLRAIATYFR